MEVENEAQCSLMHSKENNTHKYLIRNVSIITSKDRCEDMTGQESPLTWLFSCLVRCCLSSVQIFMPCPYLLLKSLHPALTP